MVVWRWWWRWRWWWWLISNLLSVSNVLNAFLLNCSALPRGNTLGEKTLVGNTLGGNTFSRWKHGHLVNMMRLSSHFEYYEKWIPGYLVNMMRLSLHFEYYEKWIPGYTLQWTCLVWVDHWGSLFWNQCTTPVSKQQKGSVPKCNAKCEMMMLKTLIISRLNFVFLTRNSMVSLFKPFLRLLPLFPIYCEQISTFWSLLRYLKQISIFKSRRKWNAKAKLN